jgi:peptidoglycan/LPS O-acetylase OafA/YrhL
VKFRSDIQGLRGLAVLVVLADHFAPDIRQTSGGFVGVDIFFVISGYLITSIIISELENNEFLLRKFWERRIRRIFPSLVLMLAISTLFVWIISSEYVKFEFLKNLAKAATFTSNIGYSQTQDYFEGQGQNALLHLWSLAIEEQFYLVWPIICLFFHKFNKNLTIYFSYLTAVVSFLANLLFVFYFESKSIAFYNTFSRVWELMIGALLAQHVYRRRQLETQASTLLNQLISLFGLLLIGLSLVTTTETSAFPGHIALLPTLGTAAIIFAGSENFINRRLLSNRLMIWVGGISYALYLWHYPLLFLMRTISPSRTNFPLLLITLLLSVLAAYSSTRFIERPLRKDSIHRSSLNTLVFAMSAVLTFSIFNLRMSINQSDPNFVLDKYEALGWGNQSDLDCLRLRKEITVRTLRRQGCFDAPIQSDKSVFLVGDSHSGSLRAGLRPFLASKEISLYGVSTGWCGWYEIKPFDDDPICAEITKEFLASISRSKPKVLIIAGYWAKMSRSVDTEKSLVAYIDLVQSLGVKKVVIIGQVPTYDAGLPQHLQNLYISKGLSIPESTPRAQVDNDPKGTQELMQNYAYPPNVFYRSIDDLLCVKDSCRVAVGPNLETDLVVWDYGHLTEAGSRFVSENLLTDIERLLTD